MFEIQQPEESGRRWQHLLVRFLPERKVEAPHNELHSTTLVLLSDPKYNLKCFCGGENLK